MTNPKFSSLIAGFAPSHIDQNVKINNLHASFDDQFDAIYTAAKKYIKNVSDVYTCDVRILPAMARSVGMVSPDPFGIESLSSDDQFTTIIELINKYSKFGATYATSTADSGGYRDEAAMETDLVSWYNSNPDVRVAVAWRFGWSTIASIDSGEFNTLMTSVINSIIRHRVVVRDTVQRNRTKGSAGAVERMVSSNIIKNFSRYYHGEKYFYTKDYELNDFRYVVLPSLATLGAGLSVELVELSDPWNYYDGSVSSYAKPVENGYADIYNQHVPADREKITDATLEPLINPYPNWYENTTVASYDGDLAGESYSSTNHFPFPVYANSGTYSESNDKGSDNGIEIAVENNGVINTTKSYYRYRRVKVDKNVWDVESSATFGIDGMPAAVSTDYEIDTGIMVSTKLDDSGVVVEDKTISDYKFQSFDATTWPSYEVAWKKSVNGVVPNWPDFVSNDRGTAATLQNVVDQYQNDEFMYFVSRNTQDYLVYIDPVKFEESVLADGGYDLHDEYAEWIGYYCEEELVGTNNFCPTPLNGQWKAPTVGTNELLTYATVGGLTSTTSAVPENRVVISSSQVGDVVTQKYIEEAYVMVDCAVSSNGTTFAIFAPKSGIVPTSLLSYHKSGSSQYKTGTVSQVEGTLFRRLPGSDTWNVVGPAGSSFSVKLPSPLSTFCAVSTVSKVWCVDDTLFVISNRTGNVTLHPAGRHLLVVSSDLTKLYYSTSAVSMSTTYDSSSSTGVLAARYDYESDKMMFAIRGVANGIPLATIGWFDNGSKIGFVSPYSASGFDTPLLTLGIGRLVADVGSFKQKTALLVMAEDHTADGFYTTGTYIIDSNKVMSFGVLAVTESSATLTATEMYDVIPSTNNITGIVGVVCDHKNGGGLILFNTNKNTTNFNVYGLDYTSAMKVKVGSYTEWGADNEVDFVYKHYREDGDGAYSSEHNNDSSTPYVNGDRPEYSFKSNRLRVIDFDVRDGTLSMLTAPVDGLVDYLSKDDNDQPKRLVWFDHNINTADYNVIETSDETTVEDNIIDIGDNQYTDQQNNGNNGDNPIFAAGDILIVDNSPTAYTVFVCTVGGTAGFSYPNGYDGSLATVYDGTAVFDSTQYQCVTPGAINTPTNWFSGGTSSFAYSPGSVAYDCVNTGGIAKFGKYLFRYDTSGGVTGGSKRFSDFINIETDYAVGSYIYTDFYEVAVRGAYAPSIGDLRLWNNSLAPTGTNNHVCPQVRNGKRYAAQFGASWVGGLEPAWPSSGTVTDNNSLPWSASEVVATGTKRKPNVGGSSSMVYIATTGGTTSGAEPTWPVANAGTVVDGGVTWTARTATIWTTQSTQRFQYLGIMFGGTTYVPSTVPRSTFGPEMYNMMCTIDISKTLSKDAGTGYYNEYTSTMNLKNMFTVLSTNSNSMATETPSTSRVNSRIYNRVKLLEDVVLLSYDTSKNLPMAEKVVKWEQYRSNNRKTGLFDINVYGMMLPLPQTISFATTTFTKYSVGQVLSNSSDRYYTVSSNVVNLPTWQTNTQYYKGDVIMPVGGGQYYYQVDNNGTSGTVIPYLTTESVAFANSIYYNLRPISEIWDYNTYNISSGSLPFVVGQTAALGAAKYTLVSLGQIPNEKADDIKKVIEAQIRGSVDLVKPSFTMLRDVNWLNQRYFEPTLGV
jgi:hypothetical protein